MIYFKNSIGNVFAYETQHEREQFGPDDLVAMVPYEVEAHLHPVQLPPSVDQLHAQIDAAADAARRAVAGDPLRAVEYDRARIEAEQFAAAGYQGEVPPMVAAWAINGRTAQEAADDILHEAAQYSAALIALREIRLAGKEQERVFMSEGKIGKAQQLAEQTISAIESSVAGIGNAPA